MIRAHNLARRWAEIKPLYLDCLDQIMFNETVNNGFYTKEVEDWLKTNSGRKHALLTNNGSNALLVTALALGLKRGDEVIITSYSCPASETFLNLLGITPVHCEIDHTGLMDCNHLESLFTNRTRAVVATGLYGDMHNHYDIESFCSDHQLWYINDASQSMFSSFNGIQSLETGDVVCMSFAENKPLPSMGTHGAILFDTDGWVEPMRRARKHGKPHRLETYTGDGINAHPDEDNAAQILCATQHINVWQERRHKIANYYDVLFDEAGVNRRQHHPEWNTHKYAVLFPDKFQAQQLLAGRGIESEAHYPDAFAPFFWAEKYAKQSLSIPMNAHLTDAEIEKVARETIKVWKHVNITQ